MRYRLYGQKINVGSVLVYEGDDLADVKKHYDDVEQDIDFVSADIIDTLNWSVVSYIDYAVIPRNISKVKKIGIKRENIGR